MDILPAVITLAVLAGIALVILFVLGAARLSARGDTSAYYAQILRNVDIQAEFDREHRTW